VPIPLGMPRLARLATHPLISKSSHTLLFPLLLPLDTLYDGQGSRVSDPESCKAWLAASLCIRQLDKKCRRKR
jgi:hypothetical protein